MPAPLSGSASATVPSLCSDVLLRLIEHAGEFVVVIAAETHALLYANRSAQALLGLKAPAEIAGKTVEHLLPGRLLPQLLYETLPTVSTQGLWSGPSLLHSCDGTEVPVAMLLVGLADATGRMTQVALLARDNTQEVSMAENYRKEHDLLQALLQHSPDSIYFKDGASHFLRVSQYTAKLFGVASPQELVGKSDFDYFTPEHAQPAYDDEQRIMRTGQAITGLVEKETWADGRVTWVSTTKVPLRDHTGTVIGTFGFSRDITDRVQIEQERDALAQQIRLLSGSSVLPTAAHNVSRELSPHLEQLAKQLSQATAALEQVTVRLANYERLQQAACTCPESFVLVDELKKNETAASGEATCRQLKDAINAAAASSAALADIRRSLDQLAE
ncbi:MAG: PAS domain-containing protein [Opitutae bacterium]|nr:PAS domain-containing protein [Opitutae bacterium]